MSRENHSDIQRADGIRSEARYGPGGSATARRRAELAARAASRSVPRVASRAKAKRKPLLSIPRRRTIILTLSICASSAALGLLFFSPMMRVRHVRLGGVSNLLPQEIEQTRTAAKVDPHSNLFRLRLATLEKRLAALPWVAKADARRQFPNGVAVAITPRRSAAHLQADGQDWEIDSTGVIIRPLRPGATLPLVTCNGLSEAAPGARVDVLGVAGALKVLHDCAPKGGVRIAKVVVDQTGDLCLNMSDNVAIRLGQEEQLATKIDYVHRIYDEKPGIGSEVESIDLRWPESPSCVLRGAKKSKPNDSQQAAPLDAGNKPESTDRD